MSAFVDLCFGDFTEKETLAFLSGELSPDQAQTAKTADTELCQSPDGSQSEKDVISLSNHTEDEPTSPDEPVIFTKQSKRKVKKKTRKRRKSNSQLSDKSSSSEEDFTPTLPVEFDVNPVVLKDNESEERQDISPPSSLVEELDGDDGAAAKVQQLPWSNLNKKPRSSSTSASSHDGNQARRKPSPRHGSHRGQDTGKKWKEENISDGDDSETSGENFDSPVTATVANEQVEFKPTEDHEDIKENETIHKPETKEHELPSQGIEKSPVQPQAPKRWADLFSKPSNQKQEVNMNNEKPGQNGKIKTENSVQQKLSQPQNGFQRRKRSDGGKREFSENGRNAANAALNSRSGQKESFTGNSDFKHLVAEQKRYGKGQNQGPKQDRLRTSTGQSIKEGSCTPFVASNKAPASDHGRNRERHKKIAQTVPYNGEARDASLECGSVVEPGHEEGREAGASQSAPTQQKKTEELQKKSKDVMPRSIVLSKETPKDIPLNHDKQVPEPPACKSEDNVSAACDVRESVVLSENEESKSKEGVVSTEDALTHEDENEDGKNEEAHKVEGEKMNAEPGTMPSEATEEPPEKEKSSPVINSEAGKERAREEKEQKADSASVSSKGGTPWQTSKKWSDLFVTSKPQEEVNSAKKVTDYKNVNGYGSNDNGPVKKQGPRKVFSQNEEEKMKLAIEVSEILKKCNLNQSDGDIPLPRGFINTSNWCYVNSTLQALIACPKLVMCLRALIPLVDRLKISAPYSGAIVELLKEFQYLEGDWSATRRRMPDFRGAPFEPQGVYRALEKLNNHLTTAKEHHQHDAEEYLTTSLGRIDHELTELLEMAAPNTDPVEEDEEEHLPNGGVWKEVYKKNKYAVTRRVTANDTPITQIFGGEFRSYIYRNNKLDSSMVEPFLTLSLSVDGGVMSIEESLRKDFGKEDVIGEEESVTKKLLFERLPSVMIIQLKKFSYDSSNGCVKLKKNLAFYDELIIDKDLMSPFAMGKYSAEKDRLYKLCAVLYHAGRNAYCGHYITAAKYIQQWLLFDDNIVRNIALKRVLQPEGREPYILFYSRG